MFDIETDLHQKLLLEVEISSLGRLGGIMEVADILAWPQTPTAFTRRKAQGDTKEFTMTTIPEELDLSSGTVVNAIETAYLEMALHEGIHIGEALKFLRDTYGETSSVDCGFARLLDKKYGAANRHRPIYLSVWAQAAQLRHEGAADIGTSVEFFRDVEDLYAAAVKGEAA